MEADVFFVSGKFNFSVVYWKFIQIGFFLIEENFNFLSFIITGSKLGWKWDWLGLLFYSVRNRTVENSKFEIEWMDSLLQFPKNAPQNTIKITTNTRENR